MAMKAEEALAIAKSYTKKSLEGQGALKGEDGKDGVSPIVSVNTSTADTYKLDITDKNGTITTPNLVGKQGLQGIPGEKGKPADNPIVTENADNTEDVYKLDFTVGETVFTTKNIIGKQGLEGVSPSVTTNPDNTAEDYRLNITTKGGTFTTPNLRGPKGEIGPQGESAVSAINPRGDYDVNAEPSYTKSDYVTYTDGNTYVCKVDNPTNEPPIDGTVTDTYWQVIALRGAQGIAGKDGDRGADGVTFTPSIDENGVLSFTNNGGLENPEPIDIKGDNGVTFTPSIDADGYLRFTNNGNLENPEPIKVLGKDGADGKDGIDGTTYIPSIGTVTTVENNVDASAGVTVDEETKKAVFNFAIPKGANGKDGVQIDNETVSETSVWSSQKTSGKIAEKVGKTDIATTIDGKSTDTQVPSAKAVWNKSKNKIQRLLDGVDIIVYADSISNEMVTDTVRIMNATNSPYGVDNVNNDFHYTIYNINDDKFKRILAYDIRKNDMYMIVKNNNIWGTWAKLATMDKVESKYEEATLNTPVDWNTLNTKARYYFSGGATMTNSPMQVPFGELVVETVGSVCRVQKFFSFDGRLYIRRWTGSIWNDWYRFDGIAI